MKTIKFEIGDFVSVLDDDLSGQVIRVSDTSVSILTTDGFEFEFTNEEIVKHEDDLGFKRDIFKNEGLQHIVSEKEATPNYAKPKAGKKKAKDRYEPALEVDLHIHQLTDSSRGMSNHDMLTLQLDTAKRQLEFAIRNRIQNVVFIHGVGEGVLKIELEYLFGRYSNVKFYEANYQRYGLGATEVYILQNSKP